MSGASQPGLRRSVVERLRAERPPGYPSVRQWLVAGATRQPLASAAALLSGWGLLLVAVWIAALGAVGGAIAGLLGSASFFHSLFNIGFGGGVGAVAAIIGASLGAAFGFLLVYGGASYYTPVRLAGSLITGCILALAITALVIWLEPRFAQLRGYRRMSRREREQIEPLLVEAAERMNFTRVPPVYMSDTVLPNAWAHMQYIVVTKGALTVLESDELAGVLAHELQHWFAGDAVALRFIWAAAWPAAMALNILEALNRKGASLLGNLAWLVCWPGWLVTRWLIVPLTALRARDAEYQADAAAAAAGYAEGLRRALVKISQPEAGRSGWENALAKTHPPVELRLEALENPPPVPEAQPQVAEPEPQPEPPAKPTPERPEAPVLRARTAAGVVELPPIQERPKDDLWTPEQGG